MELNFYVLFAAFEWIQFIVICYLVRLGNKVQAVYYYFFLIMFNFIKVGKACK